MKPILQAIRSARMIQLFSVLVLSVGIFGFVKPSSATNFTVYQAQDNTVYAIFGNDLYDKIVLTQLIETGGAVNGLTSDIAGTLSAYEWTSSSLFTMAGQSSLIASPLVTSFDPTGSGTINFSGGISIDSGDFGAYTGIATTLFPGPPVGSFPPYNAYGFNLAPGAHPTTSLPIFGAPPSDGITIGHNQSIVFKSNPPNGVGRSVGYGLFAFNNDQAVTSSSGGVSFSPNATPPVVPEPASIFLLGSGLIGAVRARLKRK